MTGEHDPTTGIVETVRPARLRWSGRAEGRLPDGRGVEVAGVDVGELVRVALTDRGPARLLDVIEPSPHRADARCPQMADCPGCPLRTLTLTRRRALTDDLHRRALGPEAQAAPWRRLSGAADDDGRSRAVARALRDHQGCLVLGMVQRGHRPIRLGGCPLQTAGSRTLVARLEVELRALGVEPWDPETKRGTLRHVIVQALGDRARVVLAVDDRGPPIPIDRLLVDRTDVALLVDALPRRSAGLMRKPRPVRGDPWLYVVVDGERYRASPRAWTPQAPQTVPAVRRAVVEGVAAGGGERVVEVGCGIGLLSVPIARRVAELVGIDIERDAIVDAEFNTAAHGIDNTRFRTGEAAHALRRLLAAGARADAVVMHAMRRPFGAEAMAAVRALDPERVVCLSPFAPALARDLAALPGHAPVSVALCDQTPGTVPDLTIVTLVRR